jgi:hypothetical protein
MRSFRGTTSGTAALLLALSLLCGLAAAAGNRWYAGRDFECFYVAGRIAVEGGDPYDQPQYEAATAQVRPRLGEGIAPCGPRFPYPPWTTLLFTALASFDLRVASTLWLTLLVASTALGIGWTWRLVGERRVPWPVIAALVILTEPFLTALTQGQFGGLSLALTAGTAVWIRDGHERRAGLAAAALALKPQTSLISGPVLLALAIRRREWSMPIAAGVAFAAAVAVSLLLRPTWLLAWAIAPTELRGVPIVRSSTWDLATALGSWTLGIVFVGSVLAAVVALVRGRRLGYADVVGLGTALSLVVAPYAWTHDFTVLAIPWAVTLGHASAQGPSARRLLTYATLFIAAPLFWTIRILIQVAGMPEALAALMPMLTALLLAVTIRSANESATIRKTPEVT